MSEIAIALSLLSICANAWNIVQLVQLEQGMRELERERLNTDVRA